MIYKKSQEAFYDGKKRKESYPQRIDYGKKQQIAKQLLQVYDIETAEDIQDALKDLLSRTSNHILNVYFVKHRFS